MKKLSSFIALFAIVMVFNQSTFAQDAASLRAAIENHYKAIHSGDSIAVGRDHLPEMSIYFADGGLLWESGSEDAAKRSGTKVEFGKSNVAIRHFNAQLYGNVGVATFYLFGETEDSPPLYSKKGTWRVSAVWVWKNDKWMEAHHHESELETDDDE